jgi:hypothetical protein
MRVESSQEGAARGDDELSHGKRKGSGLLAGADPGAFGGGRWPGRGAGEWIEISIR